MPRTGTLWPTVLGINLWLVALLVPLSLCLSYGLPGQASIGAGASLRELLSLPGAWPLLTSCLTAPLPLVALALGLRFRGQRWAQMVLLIGVPLMTLLPSADGPLASPKLHPRLAIAVELALLLAYLAAVATLLARLPANPAPPPPGDGPAPPPATWQVAPLDGADAGRASRSSARLRRRIFTYRLLTVMSALVPALLFYAIGLDEDNARALRQSFGSPARVAAVQATFCAAAAMLWAVTAHFGLLRPLRAHLEHDRVLRAELQTTRDAARRGRPRAALYVAMVLALSGMGLLIWWSMR